MVLLQNTPVHRILDARSFKVSGAKTDGVEGQQAAPAGRRMGHAGAIISGESDTANAKVARNPAHIGHTVLKAMQANGIN